MKPTYEELVSAINRAAVSIKLSALNQDHLAKDASARRAWDEADGHRHTASVLHDQAKSMRALFEAAYAK